MDEKTESQLRELCLGPEEDFLKYLSELHAKDKNDERIPFLLGARLFALGQAAAA